jgi:hypothetical protein
MQTHPLTILMGTIGIIFLIALVLLGFSCILYKFESENYEFLKPYYEYAKEKKVC